MKLNKITPYDNYTTFNSSFQLFLPMDISVNIPKTSPVKVISKVLEGLDYRKLMQSYFDTKGRRAKIEPTKMFFILAYSMYDGIYSLRKIEKACRENINFMWILRGSSAPDHNTIQRFISNNREAIEELFEQFIIKLLELDEIDLENVFIDGTKIEAYSNKYTFVWKKSVLKFYEKLKLKAIEFWVKFNEENSSEFNDIYEIHKHLEEKIEEEKIEFNQGKGKRKTKIQKDYEEVNSYIEKEREYQTHLKILGERNSYSKTDKDATFMRMKEDYMKNGQLKPAYNLQIAVNSEYIVGLDIFSNPMDTRTLCPFLKTLESKKLKFKNIVADAGYESEENYEFLEKNDYMAFIKPKSYEKEKTKKFKNDISKVENMKYLEEDDYYICANGKKLNYQNTIVRKNVSGYESKKKVYICEDCSNCPMANKCKKSKGNRTLQVSSQFLAYRKESQENITSKKGIKLRVNRSIQVEGAFGVLKEDMQVKRLRYRSKEKVKTELILLSLGYNLRKFIHKKEKLREGMKLHKIN